MVLGYGYILGALEIVVMYYQPKAERKTDDFKGVPRKKIKGCPSETPFNGSKYVWL